MVGTRLNIKTFSLEDLSAKLASMGLKKYRSAQVFGWIYKRLAGSFDVMTDISKEERVLLADCFSIPSLELLGVEVSADCTRKFLFRLEDGHTIESVLIPDDDRSTLCVSSQVGCRQGCRFCLTARGGFVRDLASYEIVEQVIEVSRILKNEGKRGITNIVLMGMGEPLANLDEVSKALKVITSGAGMAVSARRVTLSTSGLVPELGMLGESGLRVNIAISLNATTDEVRDQIMPVNRRWPLKELTAACRRYPLEPRRRITFEYVLLKGVNDSDEDALRLVRLLRGIRCKVNLIPFNPFPESTFDRPDNERIRGFQKLLLAHHLTAPVRESRGRDISAACGQLKERMLTSLQASRSPH